MNVYFDNAATTRLSDEVLEEMKPYLQEEYGNPSAMYSLGRKTKKAIETARERVAAAIGAEPEEIYFTSGGSESDNWAVKGIAEAYSSKGKHIITTAIEHKAILKSCKWLEDHGFEVSYVEPDSRGYIHLNSIRSLIRDDTILVSVMTANNEIGTLQPIEFIGKLCEEHGIIFHTDAV